MKVRRYDDRMIDPNDYLDESPRTKASYNNVEVVLEKHILNSMPNRCSKQAYVQGFDFETITFKNMSKCLNTWKLRKLSMTLL